MSVTSDRFVRVLLIAVAAVTALSLVVGMLSAPYIVSGANNSDQVVKGNDLQACRSQSGLQVTDARTSVDEARTRYEVDFGNALQVAFQRGDVAAALAAVNEDATAIGVATRAERIAQDAYSAAVDQSRTNPDQFLQTCKGQP